MLELPNSNASHEAASRLRSQWANPKNILDLLLLVGGDIIAIALAQLTGSHWYWPTPVVFSFGWVAYAFKQIATIFGHSRLLTPTDVPSVVINGRSGYARSNSSWILGRLLRDFENGYWMDRGIRAELQKMLDSEGKPKAGLCISLFNATSDKDIPESVTELEKGGEPATEPKRDALWKLGYLVAFLQLSIAAIPWAMWREWEVFVVTAAGTILSFLAGSVGQWRRERWCCRRLSGNGTYVITRGNGAQHALLIFAKRGSLNFEDLATSIEAIDMPVWTKLVALGQLILWIALLITVDGLESQTWFLIWIGGLGMLYTTFVALAPRKPESWGIKLDPVEERPCIISHKVMLALIELEKAYPGVGLATLGTFFPGSMSQDEEAFWNKARIYFKLRYPNEGSQSVNREASSSIKILNQQIEERKKQ